MADLNYGGATKSIPYISKGTGTLVAGTLLVADVNATTGCAIIFIHTTSAKGFWSYTVINATSFTVTSSDLTDVGDFTYYILG